MGDVDVVVVVVVVFAALVGLQDGLAAARVVMMWLFSMWLSLEA